MAKRILTMFLVSAFAVVCGVAIVKKKSDDSKLNVILERQDKILSGQKKLQNSPAGQRVNSGVQNGNVANLLNKQRLLEGRIASLESRIQTLQNTINSAQAAPQPVRQGPPPEDLSKVHDIPVDHSYLIGKKNAPITIVEFVDFQCPFCARFHPPVKEVMKAYPGKVNYMVKNFPLSFHPQAKPASKAAFAAGEQGKYAEMADLLLENGKDLNDAKFVELAKGLGLNVDKFQKDLSDNDAKYEKLIQKDIQLGATVGVRGTPTFYLNGKKTNARDFNGFKTQIDAILGGN